MHERLSRRALLRAAGLAGLAAGVGGAPASATPDDPADSGRATFGPVEARGPNGGWVTVTGTGDENVVLGQETNLQ